MILNHRRRKLLLMKCYDQARLTCRGFQIFDRDKVALCSEQLTDFHIDIAQKSVFKYLWTTPPRVTKLTFFATDVKL